MKNKAALKIESVKMTIDRDSNERGTYLVSHKNLYYTLLINGFIGDQKVYFYVNTKVKQFSGLTNRLELSSKETWLKYESEFIGWDKTLIASHDRLADGKTILEDKRSIIPAIKEGDEITISYKVAKVGKIANRLNYVKLI